MRKITLIAGLFLLPVLINAQNNGSYNPEKTQIIITGAEVIMNGDTLNKEVSLEMISAIGNVLTKEKTRQEAEAKATQDLDNLKKRILESYPALREEQVDKVVNNLPKGYSNPKDIRYYKEATLTKKGYFPDAQHSYYTMQTINVNYKDSLFLFYSRDLYDEGEHWCHWILFVADVNAGKVQRLDENQTYLEYTLKSQDPKVKEKIFYPSETCTFEKLKK